LSKIGRITTAGVVTEYATPTANSGPFSITVGSDNNLWFTEFNAGKIGKITTAGVITEYTSSSFFRPWNITSGPDGALWFTDNSSGAVGRLPTTGTGATEYAVPGSGAGNDREPYGIVAGPDGALWITDFLGAIDRMTTAGTVANRYLIGSSQPDIIVPGPDGALWYTLSFQYAIGHITTTGTNHFFPTPTGGPQSYSNGIAVGGDGALWFALNASAIGRITTAGVVTECPTPTKPVGGTSLPFGMTAGPDAAMWFTENQAGKIGHIALSSVTAVRRQPMHK
jgi:virginiamycin B lyase